MTGARILATSVVFSIIFFALGCTSTKAPQTTSQAATETPVITTPGPIEHILDTFEVGKNVFVRALRFDSSGNTLWVGTSTGVHEIDTRTNTPRHTFTREQGLANEYVFAVGIDNEGYKWFGTNAGGASRYKDEKWKTYFPMHGLADYWVYAFANDPKGGVWIGTWAGANYFDLKTEKFTTYLKELVNEWVYGIDVDAQGRVWFGTEGGVSMFDGKKWKAWTHNEGLGGANADGAAVSTNTGLGTRTRHDLSIMMGGKTSYNPSYVFCILAAPDNTVWAGTWGGGAARFDGKQWTNFTSKDGLAGDVVYAVARDAKGAFWFGTNNGVSKFDGTAWRNFGQAEGLLDNNVYAVAVAPNGDIWAGTRRGVTRIGLD
ncbi:MAG: two-component regulator propeller domain-containing protein [Gallionellaceae bacterium]|nr:two-component regulator propeller domain-containing protein [Gallionellaceae bacterium]